MPDLLSRLAEIIKENSRSIAFARSFDIVKLLSGSEDPYADTKAKLGDVCRKILPRIEAHLEAHQWDVLEAMRVSAAANIVDTSVLGYEAKNIEEAIWDRPVIEETIIPPKDKDIYVVLDNAGEALVDMLLVKALRANGYRAYLVVRKESYEIDVLRKDLDNAEVIETPGNLPPIFYIGSGFVIAKGIANAEAYIEAGRVPSIHLLRAKCDVIAKVFGVPKNSPLIVSGETMRKAFLEQKQVR